MAYIFENVPRKVYPKTFLKDVQLSIYYSQFVVDENQALELTRFFNEEFKVNFKEADFNKGVALNTIDEKIRCDFGPDHLRLVIKHPRYKSFDFISDYWFAVFERLLSITGVSEVTRITLSKYNELEFQMTNGQTNVMDLLPYVFSKELLETAAPDRNNVTESDTTIRWEGRGSHLNIDNQGGTFYYEFGFRRNVEKPVNGMFTLKTTVSSVDMHFSFAQMCSQFRKYNQILFDGFHWCVTESIVKNMSEQ